MDRLQKKCAIASTGVHGLLLLILFVGPAFVSQNTPPAVDMPILDFVPIKTVDALVSGGGNPNAKSSAAPVELPKPNPTPPQAPPPKPEPELLKPDPAPPKVKQPEPAKEQVRPEPDPDSLEAEMKKKPKRPSISTKVVDRKKDSSSDAKAKAEDQAARKREKEAAEARNRIASAIGSMAANLGNGLSAGTTIELKGPGGGGIPYANFLQAVKSVYARAWHVPDGVTDEDATAVASVTIARDGSVVTSRITKSSGNTEVDRSVRATLDRVTYAAPLPDDAKEDQRTVSINFNVRARRSLG